MSALRNALRDHLNIDDARLDAVERFAAFSGLCFADKALAAGLLTTEALLELLLALGAVDATDELVHATTTAESRTWFQRAWAERNRALPLRIEGQRLFVAMLDPSDRAAVERLAFATGLAIEPRAALADVLYASLAQSYGVVRPSSQAAVFQAMTGPTPEPTPLFIDVDVGSFAPAMTPNAAPQPQLRAHPTAARDSLPPQVFPVLVPHFHAAVLFLVRDALAIGWDARAIGNLAVDVRDVLLPLTADSIFQRAFTWRRAIVATPAEPSTVEHIFLRFLGAAPPKAFAVVPVVVGDEVVALLYVERVDRMIDGADVDIARRAGTALADGLAPLVAARQLFPAR